MRHDEGKGDVVDIVDIESGSSEAAKVKKIYETFVAQWQFYALELGLPFDVDTDIREWADEILTPPLNFCHQRKRPFGGAHSQMDTS
jgi:hypothetical protein